MNRKKFVATAAITTLALTFVFGGSVVSAAPDDNAAIARPLLRLMNLTDTESALPERPSRFEKGFGFSRQPSVPAEMIESMKSALAEKGIETDGLSDFEIIEKAFENDALPEGFNVRKKSGEDGEAGFFGFSKHRMMPEDMLDSIKNALIEKGVETDGLSNDELMEKAAENGILPELPKLQGDSVQVRKFSAEDLAAELGVDTTGMTDAQIIAAVKAAQFESLKAVLTEKGIETDGLTERELIQKAIENNIEIDIPGLRVKFGADGTMPGGKAGRGIRPNGMTRPELPADESSTSQTL